MDKLVKKYDMEPKTHLTSSQGALGVRNQFLGCIRVIPMLRLIPQLLRSSEIELFEGTVGAEEEIHLDSLYECSYLRIQTY